MLNTFSDFLNEPHRYKNICNNLEMEHIFVKILSRENNVIKMVNAIHHNITPIAICVAEIEAYVDSIPNSSITFDRNVDAVKADNCRQAVGAMIAFILKPFGFEKIKGGNRPIPAEYKGKHFFSGARYSKTGSATLTIEQKIVPIESNN